MRIGQQQDIHNLLLWTVCADREAVPLSLICRGEMDGWKDLIRKVLALRLPNGEYSSHVQKPEGLRDLTGEILSPGPHDSSFDDRTGTLSAVQERAAAPPDRRNPRWKFCETGKKMAASRIATPLLGAAGEGIRTVTHDGKRGRTLTGGHQRSYPFAPA